MELHSSILYLCSSYDGENCALCVTMDSQHYSTTQYNAETELAEAQTEEARRRKQRRLLQLVRDFSNASSASGGASGGVSSSNTASQVFAVNVLVSPCGTGVFWSKVKLFSSDRISIIDVHDFHTSISIAEHHSQPHIHYTPLNRRTPALLPRPPPPPAATD